MYTIKYEGLFLSLWKLVFPQVGKISKFWKKKVWISAIKISASIQIRFIWDWSLKNVIIVTSLFKLFVAMSTHFNIWKRKKRDPSVPLATSMAFQFSLPNWLPWWAPKFKAFRFKPPWSYFDTVHLCNIEINHGGYTGYTGFL